jgi:hypothetical protein
MMSLSDILFGIPSVCSPTEFSTKILYYSHILEPRQFYSPGNNIHDLYESRSFSLCSTLNAFI